MNACLHAYICRNSQNCNALEDGLPGSDVLSLFWQHTTKLGGDFPSVHPDLEEVVDQSEDRGQREGGHEQSHKAKLDDWTGARR